MMPTGIAGWPWSTMLWPMQFAQTLFAAPENLQQSILPWTFAGVVVNESNSTDPSMERAIVAEESYGKQIGRISDALDSLITETHVPRDKAINEFLKLKTHIDEIKCGTETRRFEAVLSDLRTLKRKNRARFDECMKRVAELDAD